MLAALEANFKPATFSHAFATLLSLINDIQAEEGIHEVRACFEGHLHDMSQSTVSIPPIFQAMLFLRALYPRVTKQSLTCLLQNRRTSPSPQSILLLRMHNSWMSFLSLVRMATLVPSRMMH
jgi:hypothetical protein